MPAFETPWVDGLTIGEMLHRSADSFSDCDAVVFPHLDGECNTYHPEKPPERCYRLSFRELDDAVDAVARALMAVGVAKGDHVAVWGTNWPQWVLLQFATARVGAVQVTINPAYRSSELGYVLKQSDTKVLFLIDKFRGCDYHGIASGVVKELGASTSGPLASAEFPKLKRVISMRPHASPGIPGWDTFVALGESISSDELRARESELSADDAINIQYTSGTTGFPKGATLTHRNILLNAYYVGECQDVTSRDRICVPVPFYHCFGCVLGVLCCAVHSAALIGPAEYFDARATLAAIERERATAVYGVPTMFIAMLENPDRPKMDLSSLRTGIMAGSPCPIEIMKRVGEELGAREITIAYGLTEASPVITQTRTDDPVDLRVQTVGRPIPGIEVKVVDPATGETLGDDQQGELCTRGHVVMLGYYNMPEQTAAAIDADGWLHSGDLAVRKPNGYYRITGRMKDMICRGGENIYPREIEEFLYTHPAIQDVAIVGVPDPRFVEEVAAWIRLKEDATVTDEEIRQFCREHLARFKVPRYIRFVTEFPQTVTGKIQKFKIRELMIEELGLEQAETA